MAHEFDGKKYEQASAHQKEWGARLIADLSLRGDERVLDLGCGDGTLTARIAERVPDGEVVGIDASQGMIDVALQKRRPHLHFVLMDIDGLGFAEEFDVVFSNATLHWVKDHGRLLQNVRRCLRDGGVLRFNFGGDGNCVHFFAVVRQAVRLDEFAGYFSTFDWPWYMPTVTEYEALVAHPGFREARVWPENADRFFPDADALTGWIDQPSLVPFLACVAEKDKPSFRERVVAKMIEKTLQNDGTCFETFRRINVSARK